MKIDIKVPSPGESITQVQLANWLVEDGEFVEKDQEIAEIDSDKATLSISAEADGVIKIAIEAGETIDVGTIIATIDTEAKGEKKRKKEVNIDLEKIKKADNSSIPQKKAEDNSVSKPSVAHISPLAQKLMQKHDISETELMEFFKSVRVSKKDVEFFVSEKDNYKTSDMPKASWGGSRDSNRKKMSSLRTKLAERLVSVKNETAMLTTFNEVNMTPIMNIRKQYKELFKEKHGVGLGFMSFFTKAITESLQYFPQVNAMIDGDEFVFHDYADIGIAVSAPKGLLVPVVRNAETLSLAEIELEIKRLAIKARDNKISLDDMKGGTFTITNGGVFGSMLSTPIINPPQSAILGMHNIIERPIAVNGKVEIHPMMYIALSYDHRIIDGKDSVGFLVKVKELLENPIQMLFSGNDPLTKLLDI